MVKEPNIVEYNQDISNLFLKTDSNKYKQVSELRDKNGRETIKEDRRQE